MSNPNEWIAKFLASADVDQLEAISIPVSEQQSLGMSTLLKGWHIHVSRIESELELPDSDRTVWVAHDLIAALAIRSVIQRGLRRVGANYPAGFGEALDEVDAKFARITEGDEHGVVRRIDAGYRPEDEWWWNRMPKIGPIRRDLDRMSRYSDSADN
jgi:hypothetical protein